MMNKKIYDLINDYQPFDEHEIEVKKAMLQFINNNEDVLTRDNKIGHFASSAWIVNKERTKVLMIYHNLYKSWAWVGGHADGDSDLLHVALKETEEETGLTNVKVLDNNLFGINISPVEEHIKRGNLVNTHLHLDVVYLLEADEEDTIRIKEDENSDIKWIDIDKIDELNIEEVMLPVYKRLNKKLKTLEK